MIDLMTAIQNLTPNAECVVRGTEIEWHSTDITQPTDAEITAEITRLQAEYDSLAYARDRAEAYPSIADQLDKIYHSGVAGWKADIKVIKDANPKPE